MVRSDQSEQHPGLINGSVVSAFAPLTAPGLAGEIASPRPPLLKSLREIDDPFQRAIAVAKLAEAQARVQGAARAAEPAGADELGRVLAGVLAEMGEAVGERAPGSGGAGSGQFEEQVANGVVAVE